MNQKPDALSPRALQQKLGLAGGAETPNVDLSSLRCGYDIGAGGYLNYDVQYTAIPSTAIVGNVFIPLTFGSTDDIYSLDFLKLYLTCVNPVTFELELLVPIAGTRIGFASYSGLATGFLEMTKLNTWLGAAAVDARRHLPDFALSPGWGIQLSFAGGAAGSTVVGHCVWCSTPRSTALPR